MALAQSFVWNCQKLTLHISREHLNKSSRWNTYKGDKDGFSDLIVIKSDQHLANPTLGSKAGNNADGSKQT